MKKKYIIFLFFLLIIPLYSAKAKDVTIHFFHSNTCPHCKSEKKFLESLDNVNIKYYEVSEYYKLYELVNDKLNIKTTGVPVTIIGSNYTIGYSDDIKYQIEDMIDAYSNTDYCDSVDLIKDGKDIDKCLNKNKNIYNKSDIRSVSILGKTFRFNIKKVSLPLISIIIGFIDGFNPCAMWVLIFLISMLFNMKDKKKMWILGITFLATSSIVYLIFMMGILKIVNSFNNIFKYLIALVALIGGILNIRSFVKSLNKNIGCQVTNKNQKKKIIDKIKNIVNEKNFLIAMIGIMLLAVSVNLVELACSAGLPTLFVEILSINNIKGVSSYIYMLLYILLFMIDDIVIFVIAMVTLKVTGISNKYTKYSHLIGGIIMLLIGILMIFKVDWLMFNF